MLVNNAGAYPRIPWDELGEDEWARAIESNLTIHYRTCRAITPDMAERRWGRIVNIGSVNARVGRPAPLPSRPDYRAPATSCRNRAGAGNPSSARRRRS
ncbi:SDR family NAD(P)-dependent oxidoreductase [Kitasatospora sp. NPDC101155]|uniref:SDR family NAD(P)-dependent oxidoreductase n=1 Tax=Kitasatospora sp. NPDC101155 TaxID=3364097 RepID=UPI003830A26D